MDNFSQGICNLSDKALVIFCYAAIMENAMKFS